MLVSQLNNSNTKCKFTFKRRSSFIHRILRKWNRIQSGIVSHDEYVFNTYTVSRSKSSFPRNEFDGLTLNYVEVFAIRSKRRAMFMKIEFPKFHCTPITLRVMENGPHGISDPYFLVLAFTHSKWN